VVHSQNTKTSTNQAHHSSYDVGGSTTMFATQVTWVRFPVLAIYIKSIYFISIYPASERRREAAYENLTYCNESLPTSVCHLRDDPSYCLPLEVLSPREGDLLPFPFDATVLPSEEPFEEGPISFEEGLPRFAGQRPLDPPFSLIAAAFMAAAAAAAAAAPAAAAAEDAKASID
jgi:hypothetical protein